MFIHLMPAPVSYKMELSIRYNSNKKIGLAWILATNEEKSLELRKMKLLNLNF